MYSIGVYGLVSAGKTSFVRSLIGKDVGDVKMKQSTFNETKYESDYIIYDSCERITDLVIWISDIETAFMDSNELEAYRKLRNRVHVANKKGICSRLIIILNKYDFDDEDYEEIYESVKQKVKEPVFRYSSFIAQIRKWTESSELRKISNNCIKMLKVAQVDLKDQLDSFKSHKIINPSRIEVGANGNPDNFNIGQLLEMDRESIRREAFRFYMCGDWISRALNIDTEKYFDSDDIFTFFDLWRDTDFTTPSKAGKNLGRYYIIALKLYNQIMKKDDEFLSIVFTEHINRFYAEINKIVAGRIYGICIDFIKVGDTKIFLPSLSFYKLTFDLDFNMIYDIRIDSELYTFDREVYYHAGVDRKRICSFKLIHSIMIYGTYYYNYKGCSLQKRKTYMLLNQNERLIFQCILHMETTQDSINKFRQADKFIKTICSIYFETYDRALDSNESRFNYIRKLYSSPTLQKIILG